MPPSTASGIRGARAAAATPPPRRRARAVAAAHAAFDGEWHTWSQTRRGQTLARLAALVRTHLEELAHLETENMGKPISSARWEIGAVANVMEYYGGAANKLMGETIPVSKPGFDFTL